MSNPDFIPFLDLIAPHIELEEQLVAVFSTALRSAAFVGGEGVKTFEREFADFCRVRYCVGVGSGTDALRFAIMATGVAPGDMVITVPNTFIATTEAITQAGAHIAFVDIDERTYNIDVDKLRVFLETECVISDYGRLVEKKSGRHVSAIVPVHLYGQMADMDAILDIAGSYGLIVIEDACQAHGAEYFSRKTGKWHSAGTMVKPRHLVSTPGKISERVGRPAP